MDIQAADKDIELVQEEIRTLYEQVETSEAAIDEATYTYQDILGKLGVYLAGKANLAQHIEAVRKAIKNTESEMTELREKKAEAESALQKSNMEREKLTASVPIVKREAWDALQKNTRLMHHAKRKLRPTDVNKVKREIAIEGTKRKKLLYDHLHESFDTEEKNPAPSPSDPSPSPTSEMDIEAPNSEQRASTEDLNSSGDVEGESPKDGEDKDEASS